MNKYLEKIAAKEKKAKPVTEKPHVIRALQKLEDKDAVILDHSTGSGKSRLFLKAVERELKRHKSGRALIVAPASLQSNIEKEVKKHGLDIDLSRVDVRSYEKAVNDVESLRKNKYLIAVADEAHKLRSTNTKRHQELSGLISGADKKVLATATTAYNHPSDIASLVNIAAGAPILPKDKKTFDERFLTTTTEQPSILKRILGAQPEVKQNLNKRNSKELKEKLNRYIDKYDLADDPAAKGSFPDKIEKTIEVPMSSEQHAMYRYMEGKLPFSLRMKIKLNLPLDKKESANLNAFSTGLRQVSNSIKPFMASSTHITPKIMKAVDSLEMSQKENKNFRGVVYSNYLQAGLNDYSEELTRRKISHTVFHGGLSKKQKDQAVEDYNSGKTPVLLISSSGAEGLNLKGTRKLQVLEPHFNKSKVNQVMGRGIRYGSHDHLPKSERNVEIEHYLSTLPQSKGFSLKPKMHSIDSYLTHNSKAKSDVTDQMRELVDNGD